MKIIFLSFVLLAQTGWGQQDPNTGVLNDLGAQAPADLNLSTQNPEGYTYDPTGRRDPFAPYRTEAQPVLQDTAIPTVPRDQSSPIMPSVPLDPLLSYDISQLKVVGIIWEVTNPKAIVKDPAGKLHMVKKNSKIGRYNGFVSAIREGEVEVVEPQGEGEVRTATTRSMPLTK